MNKPLYNLAGIYTRFRLIFIATSYYGKVYFPSPWSLLFWWIKFQSNRHMMRGFGNSVLLNGSRWFPSRKLLVIGNPSRDTGRLSCEILRWYGMKTCFLFSWTSSFSFGRGIWPISHWARIENYSHIMRLDKLLLKRNKWFNRMFASTDSHKKPWFSQKRISKHLSNR